jgi:RNA polymerase sigma factor (TIGR02999 family)
MGETSRREATQILLQLSGQRGVDRGERERLFGIVYTELRKIAGSLMRKERRGHTLQPTALVHEAYVKLIDQSGLEWQNRAHFLHIAARAMRQILVDHARRHSASKRGGDLQRVTLKSSLDGARDRQFEVLDLERVLTKLFELDERMARVVEMRIFAGMDMEGIAEVLKVSRRTIYDDWAVARPWLARELTSEIQ